MTYLLLYFLFSFFPVVYSFAVSFTNWNGFGQTAAFVGIDNYVRALSNDKFFWLSLTNTLLQMALSVPAMIIIGLLLATLLKDFVKKGLNAVQLMNFMPYLVTSVAVGLLFETLFSTKGGFVHELILSLGGEPVYWLGTPWGARSMVAIMTVWKNFGYVMVMFLAGLSVIPEDLYESARIDGARWWQQFTHITLPMLRPILIFVFLTSVINAFKLFDGPQIVFSGLSSTPYGGPERSVLSMMMYFYDAAFRRFEFGYGSAIAYCLFIIIVLCSTLSYRFLSKEND